MKGHIRARGVGTWEISWPDASMKSGRKTMNVKGAKRDAQRKLRDILTSLDEGTYATPTKQTVGDFLTAWIKGVEGTVSVSSYDRYSRIVTKNLKPALGHIQLTSLKVTDIEAAYERWKKEGLSGTTIRLYHAVLHRALESAVRRDMIPKNPAAYSEPPRTDDYTPNIISDKEMRDLCSLVKGTDLHGPVALAICTGMRAGEICALKWTDLDLEQRRLSVTRTISRLGKGMVERPAKTDQARRMVDLPDFAVEVLSGLPRESEYVFPRRNGKPRDPSVLSKAVREVARTLGIELTMHTFRHSHATQMMKMGVNPKIVAERLGHSRVGFTLDRYSHSAPSLQREAADKIGNSLADTPGSMAD